MPWQRLKRPLQHDLSGNGIVGRGMSGKRGLAVAFLSFGSRIGTSGNRSLDGSRSNARGIRIQICCIADYVAFQPMTLAIQSQSTRPRRHAPESYLKRFHRSHHEVAHR